MTDYVSPAALPRQFLERADVREALAAHDFGTVFQLARKYTGVSYQKIADACGIKMDRVAKLVRGEVRITTIDKFRQISDALRIPGALLGLAAREWEQAPGLVAKPAEAPSTVGRVVRRESESVDLLSGLTGGVNPIARGLSAFQAASPMEGRTTQETAELLVKVFLHLDDELGGDSLFVPVSRYVSRLAVKVEADPDDGLHGFAQLSQMAGWLALDANRHADARRYLTIAVYAAHEADDPGLAASAMVYMSTQETYRGNAKRALSAAMAAAANDAPDLTAFTRTVIRARLARTHAAMGNASACLKSLDEMRDAFASSGNDQEPLWLSYVDEIEVSAQAGACYLELGHADEAIASLTHALTRLTEVAPNRARDRVHYLSRIAKSHLLAGDVEAACDVAGQAITLGEEMGSARILERIGEFNESLDRYATAAPVQAFRQQFRDTARTIMLPREPN